MQVVCVFSFFPIQPESQGFGFVYFRPATSILLVYNGSGQGLGRPVRGSSITVRCPLRSVCAVLAGAFLLFYRNDPYEERLPEPWKPLM